MSCYNFFFEFSWIWRQVNTCPVHAGGSIPAQREPGAAEEQRWDLNFWGLVTSIETVLQF